MNSSSAGTAATAFWIVSSEQATRSCTLYRPRAFPRRSAAKPLAASAKAPDRKSPSASPPPGGVASARGGVVGGGTGGAVDGGAAAVAGGRVASGDGLGAAGIVVGVATDAGVARGPTTTGAACAGRRTGKLRGRAAGRRSGIAGRNCGSQRSARGRSGGRAAPIDEADGLRSASRAARSSLLGREPGTVRCSSAWPWSDGTDGTSSNDDSAGAAGAGAKDTVAVLGSASD